MIEDQITLAVKDLQKLKDELKEVKKSIKQEEKIEDENYETLKRTYKDLRKQLKDYEDEQLEEVRKDDNYHQLVEMKVKKEEEIALANEKLYAQVEKLPKKPFELRTEGDSGLLVIQVLPEMRVYLNGREHRKVE